MGSSTDIHVEMLIWRGQRESMHSLIDILRKVVREEDDPVKKLLARQGPRIPGEELVGNGKGGERLSWACVSSVGWCGLC